ncbi:MAG TPA: helix-turn-helix transcriptional regulator [Candidatus Nanopelagicales bacterium]|nr:helix-turn-helix transcriptional regulator [Candidatus Nanopelagicales bacterium]
MSPRPGAEDPTRFGIRLRRLREAAGLSQVALAGDDLHPSYISLLESGRRAPTPAAIEIIARRLGVPADDLSGASRRDLEGPVALAESALGLGRPQEALDLLDPWAGDLASEPLSGSPLLMRAARARATALERFGRLQDAIVLLERIADAFDASPASPERLDVLVALVRCYRNAGDLDRAIDVGERERSRLQSVLSGRLHTHAALVSTLASAYSERGDLVRSATLLDDLIEETSVHGTLEEQASAYWNAAITATERGNAREGLQLAEQAATLLSVGSNLRARARVQVTKAWVLLAQDPPRASEARTLIRAALPDLRQHDGEYILAEAETELARCEVLLGRPDVARRHAQSALRRLAGDQNVERARALAALGSALLQAGDAQAGQTALDEAAVSLEGVQASRQAAVVWRQLADVHKAAGDIDQALAAAERAMAAVGLGTETVSLVGAPRPGEVRAEKTRSRT